MSRRIATLSLAALALLLSTPSAQAHTGHGPASAGFAAGLAHPLSGLDHILAMIAVGVWAGRLGGRFVWALPAGFVAMMIAGAALGFGAVPLPAGEIGAALSVLVLGLLIAFVSRAPLAGALALVAAFAIVHGHTHGQELAAGLSGLTYTLGFTLATAALHLGGILLARQMERIGSPSVYPMCGTTIAFGGAACIAAAILPAG